MAYSDIDSGKVLNKEGLLELCSQIKTEIASNSSGGSSYTAGNGINIDNNNVISRERIDLGEPIFSIIGAGLFTNLSFGTNLGNQNTIAGVASSLKTNKIAITAGNFGWTSMSPKDLNDEMGTAYPVYKFTIDPTTNAVISNNQSAYNATNNINTSANRALGLMIVNGKIYCVENGLNGLRQLFGFMMGQTVQIKTYDKTNTTNSRLDLIIKDLDTAISSKITAPSVPTTDGTYTLQCVVSSGTPTYSWVSV